MLTPFTLGGELDYFPTGARRCGGAHVRPAPSDASPGSSAFEVTASEERVTLTIGARRGAFTPAPRRLRVRLHLARQPTRITRDGEGMAWCWDAMQGIAELGWQDDGLAHRLEVES